MALCKNWQKNRNTGTFTEFVNFLKMKRVLRFLRKIIYVIISLTIVVGCHSKDRDVVIEGDFKINFKEGTTGEMENAFLVAIRNWSEAIDTDMPIEANIYLESIGGIKGKTLPNGSINFEGAPYSETWYTTALANMLSEKDTKPGEVDMVIYFNSTTNWYFGTDGKTPSGMADFITTAMHEIAHGLGILSLGTIRQGMGAYSIQTKEDIPIPLPFPFPDLQGRPYIFDRFVIDGNGKSIADTLVYKNPSDDLKNVYTGGDLWFNTENCLVESIKLDARSFFSDGSSISHMDEALYSDAKYIMTPRLALGVSNHVVDASVRCVLRTIGWKLTRE